MSHLLGILCVLAMTVYCNRTINPGVEDISGVREWEFYSSRHTVSKRTKVRQTSYYSDLEREIEDSKERSRAGKTRPARAVGGETGQWICVVAKCIDKWITDLWGVVIWLVFDPLICFNGQSWLLIIHSKLIWDKTCSSMNKQATWSPNHLYTNIKNQKLKKPGRGRNK